jgi:hypothetical protein
MDESGVKYGISLEFWDSDDMVIRFGPLQITSMSKDWSDWGSFEILWSDHWYFYTHYLQDCDPYNGKTFDTGEAHWVLRNMRTKKDLWCSIRESRKLQNWWYRVVNRLRGS